MNNINERAGSIKSLTRNQALDWNLQTAPPKASDSRSVNWDGGGVGARSRSRP